MFLFLQGYRYMPDALEIGWQIETSIRFSSLLRRSQRDQGIIGHPASFEELAEEFIVFEPHGLDSDDQSFETDDEEISQCNHDPVRADADDALAPLE
jgi:hypothetical protein